VTHHMCRAVRSYVHCYRVTIHLCIDISENLLRNSHYANIGKSYCPCTVSSLTNMALREMEPGYIVHKHAVIVFISGLATIPY